MNLPIRFSPLASADAHPRRNAAIIRFLDEVWDYSPVEYTFLYTRRSGTDRMVPQPLRGDRADKVRQLLKACPPESYDYYFCPNSFDAPRNTKGRALPTRYAWADIDGADPAGFIPKPNILWETSAGRYQGLWIWKDIVPPREAERYSECLWKLYGGDSGAWAANKLLRVPGTINHKPQRHGDRVRLLQFTDRPKTIPTAIRDMRCERAAIESSGDLDPLKHDPEVLMRQYRTKMGPSAGTFMRAQRVVYHDRSAAVGSVIAKLVELGADNDEIASIVWVNVYFNAKWPGDLRELERQIVKIRSDVEAGR